MRWLDFRSNFIAKQTYTMYYCSACNYFMQKKEKTGVEFIASHKYHQIELQIIYYQNQTTFLCTLPDFLHPHNCMVSTGWFLPHIAVLPFLVRYIVFDSILLRQVGRVQRDQGMGLLKGRKYWGYLPTRKSTNERVPPILNFNFQ